MITFGTVLLVVQCYLFNVTCTVIPVVQYYLYNIISGTIQFYMWYNNTSGAVLPVHVLYSFTSGTVLHIVKILPVQYYLYSITSIVFITCGTELPIHY